MMLFRSGGGTWVVFLGPLRIRWKGDDHRPLFSERYGYRRWYGIGRLRARIDRAAR